MADQHEVGARLGQLLRTCGGDVAYARAAAHVPVGGWVDTSTYFSFWSALGERAPADLGLRLAETTTVRDYDMAHLAALHSPDVRAALEKIARYKRLCGPKELALEPKGRELHVHIRWPTQDLVPPHLADAALASMLVLLQRGSGTALAPVRVELMRARSEEAMLRRFYACEIRFGANRDALVLARSQLDVPFLAPNADLVALLVPTLEAKLKPRQGESFVEDVKRAITRRMAGERPSVQKIARELAVSTRTLQRRLGEHGTTYQQVLDDARHDAALRLLRGSELDISEIAFVLGFEELNSFTRAFRAWEGQTPRQWRDRMKQWRGRIGRSAPAHASSPA
jgi:AraC-like DNA-binding protein